MYSVLKRVLFALALTLSAAQLEAQERVKVRPINGVDSRARQAALAVDLILSGSKAALEAYFAEFGSSELNTDPVLQAGLAEVVNRLSHAPLTVLGVYRISGGPSNALLVRLTTGRSLAPIAVLVELDDAQAGRISAVRALQVADA